MKKILIIIAILLFYFTSNSEDRRKQSVQWMKIEDITNTRYFIWHGDTIDFIPIIESLFLTESDSTVKYVTVSQMLDSLASLPGGTDNQTLSIDSTGRIFTISIENANSVTFHDSILSEDAVDAFVTNNGYLTQVDTTETDIITSNWLNFINNHVTGIISDGDKGDITVSSSGTAWNVDNGAIASSELSDASNVPLKDQNNTWSASQIMSLSSPYWKTYNTNASSAGSGFQAYDESDVLQTGYGWNNLTNEAYIWNPNAYDFKIGLNNTEKFRLVSTGQLKLNGYISTSSFTGITVGYLGFDGSGYITTNEMSASGGNVSNTGTPVNDQIAIFTNETTIEGDADLTFDGTNLTVTGTVTSDEKRVQSLSGTSVTMNAQSGYKAYITLSGATTLTITNLPDGGEGTIEVTNPSTYTLDIDGSTGYTTEQIMGANSAIASSDHTTVVYWRINTVLYYGFIIDN